MNASIHIAMLLRKPSRTPEGVARVREIASHLGFHPTIAGRATLSCRVPVETFSQLFHMPQEVSATDKSRIDSFETRAGEWELAVPPELTDDVALIAVVPPVERLI